MAMYAREHTTKNQDNYNGRVRFGEGTGQWKKKTLAIQQGRIHGLSTE